MAEKKWLLRLPKALDDWLTLRAAEETVSRGKRISKNTLIIEMAETLSQAELSAPQVKSTGGENWQDARSALEFIQKTIELKAQEGSGVSDRIKQRMLVNLKLLGSYIEDLED
jgi:hypothetical protein